MALKATVHKVDLAVSDMDRGYYASHALTLARHPSETSERMMVRLLAFAMYADEMLAYGRGLSADIQGSRLVVFKNLGHVPQEEDAQETVRALKSFLDLR